MNNKMMMFIVILASVFVLAGCMTEPRDTPPTPGTPVNLEANTTGLLKFASEAELNTFLMDSSQNRGGVRGLAMMDTVVSKAAGAESYAPSANHADDFSQTNVQVEGVDEADFIKNDGRYIYMIQNNVLIIVDAFDAKNAEIVSETNLPKKVYASNLFLLNNKLVVLAQSDEQSYYFRKYDIMPMPSYEQVTKVLIYDITKKSSPKLVQDFKVSGSYFQSRIMDGIVYVVATKYAEYPARPPIVYAEKAISPNIYYFDNNEESYNYNTLVSIDIDKEEVIDTETYLLGYGNTLMMSEDNIYIAYQKQIHRCWGWYCRDDTYDRERFTKVVVPMLKGELKSEIESILKTKMSEDAQWEKISGMLSQFYNDVEDDVTLQSQYEDMFDDIAQALEEYDTKQVLENSKTIIHKISVDDGELSYQGSGSVDGRLLNQFSLDEYEGNLRLATTVDIWMNNGRKNYNNVYVLDKDMEVIGKIERLAQNESIYSTRFMGDKLYMVTFRQIDPFFVIDLSNPERPKVLGELKIPGYSSYLHPYNENFIIGVGKETGENQWGGATIQGVKISLFDVSDFDKPKEVDKYEIGMTGTDSPILYDHKAFLFSKSKGILVLPISEITTKNTRAGYGYDYKYWDGAYVFKVSEKGFELMGKVKHDSRSSSYYNWWDRASVTRSLYMDDNLYTISNKYIRINDLGNDLELLNTVDLPEGNDVPVPMMGGVERVMVE